MPVFDKTQNRFTGIIDAVALMQLTAKDYFADMEARLKQMDINRVRCQLQTSARGHWMMSACSSLR
jgi:hypothetical protein